MNPTTPPPVRGDKAVERPHPLTGIAKSWIALVGIVIVLGREVANHGFEAFREIGPFVWVLALFVLLFVVINLVRGIIEWRTTTFVADEEEFRIERDFLSRESSRISYGKIQSVDIQRSLAARMLGLASVQIDVGGAGGAHLEYLSRARAEALRDHLLTRMRSLAGQRPLPQPHTDAGEPADAQAAGPRRAAIETADDRQAATTGPAFQPPDWQTPAAPARAAAPAPAVAAEPVVTMSAGTLLLGVIVSGFLPWLVGGIVLISISIWLGGGFSIAAFGGLLFGLGGYLWSQVANHWRFRLTRTPQGLHITRGLFTNVSRSLRPDRIQAVSIHQDYLQRLTGLYRMRVTVLGFATGEEAGERADTILPYGRWEDVRRVLAAFWPGIELERIPLYGQPPRARWLTPLGFRRHLWGFDEQTLIAHHGWLDHTISLVPHRRMQSIGIQQGPLQRLLRLAAVEIHTTDGPVRLAAYHLDRTVARRLFDEQIERGRMAREAPGEPGYLREDAAQRPPGAVAGR